MKNDALKQQINERLEELLDSVFERAERDKWRNTIRDERTASVSIFHGGPVSTWKDWGAEIGGDGIALLAYKLTGGTDAKGDTFARCIEEGARILGLQMENNSRTMPPKRKSSTLTGGMEDLARHYGVTPDRWKQAGFTVNPSAAPWPAIEYTLHLPGGKTATKLKSIGRDEAGKRLSMVKPAGVKASSGFIGSDWRRLRGEIVVLCEGEEKTFAVKDATEFMAVSVGFGANGVTPEGAAALAAQEPARIIIAFDADDAGRDGAAKAASALWAAGIDDIRIVQWPESARKGYDLNDVLRDQGPAAVKSLLESAPPMAHDGWPSPALPGETPPAPFPLASLDKSPWLKSWVSAVATATQTPPDMAGCLALAVISAGLAGRFEVHLGNWREPANIFVCCSMPPGNRKSAVFALATAPVWKFEDELQGREREELARRRAELDAKNERLKHLRREFSKTNDSQLADELQNLAAEIDAAGEPRPKQLICADVTSETLVRLLHEQAGRVAVFSPEGDGVFKNLGGRYSRDNAANMDVFLSGHAGEPLVVNRAGTYLKIKNPALTMALTVQPLVLQSLSSRPEFRGRGLLARFLFSAPASPLGSREVDPPPVPDLINESYSRGIRQIFEAGLAVENGVETVRLAPEAERAFLEFAGQTEARLKPGSGDLSEIPDWAGKFVGAVGRLALVLHAAERPGDFRDRPIGAATVARAATVGEYFAAHAKQCFGLIQTDKDASELDNLAAWLRKTGRRSVDIRALIQRRRPGFSTRRAIEQLIETCMTAGILRPLGEENGKPSIFAVNPRIHGVIAQ